MTQRQKSDEEFFHILVILMSVQGRLSLSKLFD